MCIVFLFFCQDYIVRDQSKASVKPITVILNMNPHTLLPFHSKPKTTKEGPELVTEVKNYAGNKQAIKNPQNQKHIS